MTAFIAYLGTVVDSVTTLNQTLQTSTHAGVWPAANSAEFNDGSLSDGDNTGWRYKTDD